MKKPKTYNLKQEIYEAINKLAQDDGRSDSDWLNIHLSNSLPTKEVSKPKKPILAILEIELPNNLNMIAWDKWIAFRKKAKFKKYKTDAVMKKLSTNDFDIQDLIVQQSIDNEYQGLFALKGNNNERFTGNNQGTGQKKSAVERVNERNNLKYGQPDECRLGVGSDGGHLGRTVDEGKRGITIEHVDNQSFIDY